MRLVLVAVAVASLAAVPAAHAAPRIHYVQLQLASEAGTVTCDTSAYPAAWYPCTLEFSDQFCSEWTFDDHTGPGLPVLGSGDCALRISGPLAAIPTTVTSGHCVVETVGQFHVTFDAGAFHADVPANATVLGQPVGVSSAGAGLETGYLLDVVSFGGPALGGNVIGFQFPDVEYDCRTRAGGDPVTHTTDVGARLTWIFVE